MNATQTQIALTHDESNAGERLLLVEADGGLCMHVDGIRDDLAFLTPADARRLIDALVPFAA